MALDSVTVFCNTPFVTLENTPKLDALLRRLKKATASFGKKASLARFLHVPKPRISEWINGVYAPSAEVTLRLLEWVQAEEASQQKTPGSVNATTEGKTRSTQSRYEKRRSRPRKTYHQDRSNRKP